MSYPSSSQPYTVPPPEYATPAAGPSSNKNSVTEPLLSSGGRDVPGNAWADEGNMDDVPEDFKIGVTVSQSSASVRQAFVRKVYSILFLQLAGTTVVGAIMSTEKVSGWVQENTWAIIAPAFLALFVMFGLFWKRQSHPTNIILLGVFTLLESISVGAAVSFANQTVVLQALVITSFVFVGLTLFTFQSKYDFSNMGTYLFAALLVFFITGLVGIFFPFSKTMDAIYAGGGCLIFSGYILFDTWLIENRLSPDDWVMGCLSLYLDVLNLFLNILRLLSDLQDH